jgi:hypothetical protein
MSPTGWPWSLGDLATTIAPYDLLIGAGCACTGTRGSGRTEYISSYRWIALAPMRC